LAGQAVRRVLVASIILTVLVAASPVAAEAPSVVVEDWSRQPEGKTGIPDGWTGHDWGSPKYEFTVVADEA